VGSYRVVGVVCFLSGVPGRALRRKQFWCILSVIERLWLEKFRREKFTYFPDRGRVYAPYAPCLATPLLASKLLDKLLSSTLLDKFYYYHRVLNTRPICVSVYHYFVLFLFIPFLHHIFLYVALSYKCVY